MTWNSRRATLLLAFGITIDFLTEDDFVSLVESRAAMFGLWPIVVHLSLFPLKLWCSSRGHGSDKSTAN